MQSKYEIAIVVTCAVAAAAGLVNKVSHPAALPAESCQPGDRSICPTCPAQQRELQPLVKSGDGEITLDNSSNW